MYTVVGIQNYKKERDGRTFTATILHLAYKSDKVEGTAVENVYLNHSYVDVPVLKLDQKVNIVYNRYGKPSAVEIIE